jgi:hypothetical protein
MVEDDDPRHARDNRPQPAPDARQGAKRDHVLRLLLPHRLRRQSRRSARPRQVAVRARRPAPVGDRPLLPPTRLRPRTPRATSTNSRPHSSPKPRTRHTPKTSGSSANAPTSTSESSSSSARSRPESAQPSSANASRSSRPNAVTSPQQSEKPHRSPRTTSRSTRPAKSSTRSPTSPRRSEQQTRTPQPRVRRLPPLRLARPKRPPNTDKGAHLKRLHHRPRPSTPGR